MAWYIDPDGVTWRKRMAITVSNASGGGGVADADTLIPATWEAFWSVIDSAGNHIRVTAPDGVSLLSYDIDDGSGGTFDAAAVAARTGRIRIDGGINYAPDSIQLVWLYYDPDVTAADRSSAVVIAAALTGYIEHDGPGPRQYAYGPQGPRASNPRDVAQKSGFEGIDLWIRLDGALSKLQHASEGSRYFEEPNFATMSVVDTSNVDQASMYLTGSNRFVWVDRGVGELWLRIWVQQGTDDNFYTALPLVTTVVPDEAAGITGLDRQLLQPTVGISVRTVHFE